MLAIQHARSRDHEERLHVQPSFRVVRRGAKRTRVSTVPEVRTAKASEVWAFFQFYPMVNC